MKSFPGAVKQVGCDCSLLTQHPAQTRATVPGSMAPRSSWSPRVVVPQDHRCRPRESWVRKVTSGRSVFCMGHQTGSQFNDSDTGAPEQGSTDPSSLIRCWRPVSISSCFQVLRTKNYIMFFIHNSKYLMISKTFKSLDPTFLSSFAIHYSFSPCLSDYDSGRIYSYLWIKVLFGYTPNYKWQKMK